jgi:hypothetical protein
MQLAAEFLTSAVPTIGAKDNAERAAKVLLALMGKLEADLQLHADKADTLWQALMVTFPAVLSEWLAALGEQPLPEAHQGALCTLVQLLWVLVKEAIASGCGAGREPQELARQACAWARVLADKRLGALFMCLFLLSRPALAGLPMQEVAPAHGARHAWQGSSEAHMRVYGGSFGWLGQHACNHRGSRWDA